MSFVQLFDLTSHQGGREERAWSEWGRSKREKRREGMVVVVRIKFFF